VTTVLALDVGSSSVRAQRYDERGDPVDELRRVRSATRDPEGLVGVVREVVAGRDADVDAVGVSCFGQSLLPLNAQGRPLAKLYGWRETRSAGAAERLRGLVDAEAVRARTGAYLHPSLWPAKLLWLAETQPDVFRGAARFVSFCDYLFERLLGERAGCSLSIASGTGLLDLAGGAWDAELLSVLGVDEERLPRLSDAPAGAWYPALIDGACSNLGAGATGSRAALMVGTSTAFRLLYEMERPSPRPGLFMYRLDTGRVVEGGALSDGGNLIRWLRSTLKSDDADGRGVEDGLTFLPLLGGERSTGWDASATGALAGLTFETTPADIRRAARQGIALRVAEIAERLPETTDVVATGGALLGDRDWIQIMADALGRPVTASGVLEGSLRGAAVSVLERLGYRPSEAPLGEVFHPAQDAVEAYRFARVRQRRLYEVTNGHD